MKLNEILQERGLNAYFLEATRRVVAARFRGPDADELTQEVRLAALVALGKAASRRVEAGETEAEALRAVATRNHIASIVSLAAKETVRKRCARRKVVSLDAEAVAAPKSPSSQYAAVALEALKPLHRELYRAIADGLSPRQIAAVTRLSTRTIRDEIRKMKNAARRVAKETV